MSTCCFIYRLAAHLASRLSQQQRRYASDVCGFMCTDAKENTSNMSVFFVCGDNKLNKFVILLTF